MSRERKLEELRRNPVGRKREEVLSLLQAFGFKVKCSTHWKAKIDPGDGGSMITVGFPNQQKVAEVYVEEVVAKIDELRDRRREL